MKSIKLVSYLFFVMLLAMQAVNAQVDVLYDCPFSASSGDNTTRGFYVENYPGSTLDSVVLQFQSVGAGDRTITVTARDGTYDGPLVGSAVVTTFLDGVADQVTFDFSSVAVTPGATVTFKIEVVGDSLYYNVGTSACADVTQTNGTAPPLDTVRRAQVGVQISGTPSGIQLVPGGITVSAISGNTTEAGGTANFTIVLDTQPTATVSIDLASDNPAEGLVAPSTLVFDGSNWDTPQIVTITGQDDAVVDGDVIYSIVTSPAVSNDDAYTGLDASDVSVTNEDDDVAPVVPAAPMVPIPTLSNMALLLMAALMLLVAFRYKRVR